MRPHCVHVRRALEEHAPTVAPSMPKEVMRVLVIAIEMQQIRCYGLQHRKQWSAVEAVIFKVELPQKREDPPVARSVDDHPHITPEALRPEMLLDPADPMIRHYQTPAAPVASTFWFIPDKTAFLRLPPQLMWPLVPPE